MSMIKRGSLFFIGLAADEMNITGDVPLIKFKGLKMFMF